MGIEINWLNQLLFFPSVIEDHAVNIRKALAIAIYSFAAVVAQAQSDRNAVSGLYVGVGLGANLPTVTDVSGNYGPQREAIIGGSAEFEWGYAGVLSLGWGYGNGLRVELEGSYRQNDTKSYIEQSFRLKL